MHPEALDWVRTNISDPTKVCDIGARDINGTPRTLFDSTVDYHGIDITEGRGVDEVTDAATWTTRRRFDHVICCEVLEHTEAWRDILATAAKVCTGRLIITAACDPRRPHSTINGQPLPDDTDEWYANIDPAELEAALEVLFDDVTIQVDEQRGDVYAVAHHR
jgi:hypothetical protein